MAPSATGDERERPPRLREVSVFVGVFSLPVIFAGLICRALCLEPYEKRANKTTCVSIKPHLPPFRRRDRQKGGKGVLNEDYFGFMIDGVAPSDELPSIRLLPDDKTVPLLLMPVEHSVIVL